MNEFKLQNREKVIHYFFYLVPLPKVADQFICKDGGYVFGDRCYYPILHNPLTWVKAKEECDNKGLKLTSIQSLDQIEYLINLIQKLARSRLKVWIGLSKLNRNSYCKSMSSFLVNKRGGTIYGLLFCGILFYTTGPNC